MDRRDGMAMVVQRAPVPSINQYMICSFAFSALGVLSVFNTFSNQPELHGLLDNEIKADEYYPPDIRDILADIPAFRVLYYVLGNQVLTLILLNTYYAMLALIGRLIVNYAFKELSRQESGAARAALLTCIVFDAVFISVIAANHSFQKVLLWMVWFALNAFLIVINMICHQRFKYISPSGGAPGVGLTVVCSGIFVLSTVILVTLIFNFNHLSLSNFCFLLVDVVLAWIRSARGVLRCVLASLSVPSNTARSITYTADMTVNLSSEVVQLLHFLHLMVISPVGLNLTCIFFFYHLKMAYSSIVAILNRHLKHRAIFRHIEVSYPRLEDPSDELCIVCWEPLLDARRLPCSHSFHDWCLMWWLEQDPSCPTCRRFLSTPSEQRENPHPPVSTTWHFSGQRWFRFGGLLRLPSFSIELSHNMGGGMIRRDDSQLVTMAEQVREMFPQLPFDAIMEDLRTSGSTQATIENILEGRVGFVGTPDESDDDSWSVDPTRHDDEQRTEETSNSLEQDSSNGFAQRKRQMILTYRRRYLESAKGADLRLRGILP